MWGGHHRGLPREHDCKERMNWISNIDIFTMRTGLWTNRSTVGAPLGMWGYRCTSINNNLFCVGGYCGHDAIHDCNGYHNSVNMLDTSSLHWHQISPTTDDNSVMKRYDRGVISFDDESLFFIGGWGPHPNRPHHDTTYSKNEGEYITNECNILNTTTGKYYDNSV